MVVSASCASQSSSILRATPTPHIESKADDNIHAVVRILEVDAEQAFESRVDLEYATSGLTFRLDQTTDPHVVPRPGDEYCRRAKFWETDDPLIRRTSEKIWRSSRDANDFLLNAFAWVRDNVKLRDPQTTRFGAARAIKELAGDCDELSDLFIAFCRAASVPCRRVVGLFYHGRQDEARPFDWHAWAEVQTTENLWIPFDPSLNFYASISERHIARCCMGRRSDLPLRSLAWRSRPLRSPTLNEDDVESINLMPS